MGDPKANTVEGYIRAVTVPFSRFKILQKECKIAFQIFVRISNHQITKAEEPLKLLGIHSLFPQEVFSTINFLVFVCYHHILSMASENANRKVSLRV